MAIQNFGTEVKQWGGAIVADNHTKDIATIYIASEMVFESRRRRVGNPQPQPQQRQPTMQSNRSDSRAADMLPVRIEATQDTSICSR